MRISSLNLFKYQDPHDNCSEIDSEDYQRFLKESLDWAFLALDAEEEFLVRGLHGIGRTQLSADEIGAALGYSPETVASLEQKCFGKMRIQLGGASFYKSACLTL